MENEEANKQIIKLWRDNFEEISKIYPDRNPRWPVLSPDFKKDTILFIGINPSGDTDSKSNKEFLIKDFENLENKDKIEEIIRIEKKNIWEKGYGKYFAPFEKISKELFGKEDNFNHLDLYFLRLRSSKNFINLLEEDVKRKEKFFEPQLNISINLILNNIKPKIIFVANKNASEKIKEKFNIGESKQDKFFQEHGFYEIEINGKKVPLFLSGMISSARSIDDYSLERVIWHIKRAIEWVDKGRIARL